MAVAVQLSLPGIEYAPLKVRRYGLQEAHTHPLVSYGKDAAGQWHSSFRVPAPRAWGFPELEYGRTGTSIPALLFDMDGDPTDWLVDVLGSAMPRPNWITWRRSNDHAHVCYTLARPVLTGAQARMTPQAWLARIGEYLAAKLRADAAYSSTLAHNPMSRASRGRYRTDWLREEPYSLAELAGYVPAGWRRSIKQPLTVYGRNDTLFREGMKWSGRPANWGKWAALIEYSVTTISQIQATLSQADASAEHDLSESVGRAERAGAGRPGEAAGRDGPGPEQEGGGAVAAAEARALIRAGVRHALERDREQQAQARREREAQREQERQRARP